MKKANLIQCTNLGMTRDKTISKLTVDNAEFAYENHNIRIHVNNDNTVGSITNEKGTTEIANIPGVLLGYCKLNTNIILFILNDQTSCIYKFDTTTQTVSALYYGKLNFSTDYPIETLGYYESESVQKVYWVDGLNPMRMINIMQESFPMGVDTQFDCVGTIYHTPDITIEKTYDHNGSFLEGTIQYFATYYTKFGTETHVAWQSDLQYLSKIDRGCKEGESSNCAFKLTIKQQQDNEIYDYLRIYSVIRTSENATPTATIVADIDLNQISKQDYTIVDTGLNQIAFPASELSFIGGQNVIPSTIAQKDDTLFVGDIQLSITKIPTDSDLYIALQNDIQTATYENGLVNIQQCNSIKFEYKELPTPTFDNVYYHTQQINKSQADIAGFKHREIYRFGIQFQTSKGEWTDPIYIGDGYCNLAPKCEQDKYYIATVKYENTGTVAEALNNWNIANPNNQFIQIRLLVAETTPEQKRILAQGVVNPTMFNYYDRIHNKPHAINSWSFRPRQSQMANRHYQPIPAQDSTYAEIQGINAVKIPGFDPQQNINPDVANSYALVLLVSGDWVTEHNVGYILYKYVNDGCVNMCTYEDGNISQEGFDANQKEHNKVIYSKAAYLSGKETKNKDEARDWLVKELGRELGMTDAMIPTGKQLKDMARASEFTNNPDLVWSIVGASLVTVASIVVTCLTFGSVGALATVANSVLWSSVLATTCSVAATAGTAGIAKLANELKDAPEVDQMMAKFGFYSMLPSFNHSLQEKQRDNVVAQYNSFCENDFTFTENGGKINLITDESINGIYNESPHISAYINMGRTTFQSPRELDAITKQEQYYIDESIVTLNSPELEEVSTSIHGATNITLDLVGTIPITSNYGDVSMYTNTSGVATNSQNVNKTITNKYNSVLIEGLLNGGLYQDIKFDNYTYDDENQQWPDITPDVGLELYKIFMWNRDTSWSCYIPGVNIINPLSLNTEENKEYLSYIPAIPKKKVFANLKVSHTTNYQPFFNVTIETPKVHYTESDNLIQFNTNNTLRNYYANVNTLVINPEGYVLLKENNQPLWEQNPTDKLLVYDPVSLKYNTTLHTILPLKWNDTLNMSVLPHVKNEQMATLSDYYNNITEHTLIEGFQYTPSTLNNTYITNNWPIEELNIFESIDSRNEVIIANSTGTKTSYTFDIQTELIIGCNYVQAGMLECSDDKFMLPSQDYDRMWIRIKQNNIIVQEQTWIAPQETITCTLLPGTYDIYYGLSFGATIDPNADSSPYTLQVSNAKGELYLMYKSFTTETTWQQTQLDWTENQPYLFMGELRRNIDYETWLGGLNEFALEQLTWNVCSSGSALVRDINIDSGGEIMPTSTQQQFDDIEGTPMGGYSILLDKTWGDTYYQRWDCLKTYPTTEEDKNSVVDVLSFMVETHINLDGRCDVNRGTNNLLNARPNNFDIINTGYTQTDKFFQYKILDEKFQNNNYENQVVWSLTKTVMDDVDKWTQINAVNYLNLNGACGKLRKIINVNGVLLALQDTGISTINYNQKAAISTVEGVPVQLGNTNKVDGYTTISDTIGCHNKWSINLNSTGLYFIDDYKKSLNRYSAQNGIQSLSTLQGFNSWFNDAISGTIWNPNAADAFTISFDELTKDLYISNNETCLVYNAILDKFISFMDYVDCPVFTDCNLQSYVFHQASNNVTLNTMFTGQYNNILGLQVSYSMTYRLNPSEYTDNLFTNFTYIADLLDNDKITTDTAHLTFTSVKAWNEYQCGELDLTKTTNRHRHSKDRYRMWHGDIPRDGDTLTSHKYGSDRMRNPWLFLTLHKNTNDDNYKMVFHNLTVTYYK